MKEHKEEELMEYVVLIVGQVGPSVSTMRSGLTTACHPRQQLRRGNNTTTEDKLTNQIKSKNIHQSLIVI